MPLIPAHDQDFQLAGPMDDPSASGTSGRVRRFLTFLPKFWWIPVVTLAIGIVLEAAYVHWKQPAFVSKASMWETLKLKLPEGEFFSEDMQNYMGTLSGLLQSETLRQQALAILRAATNNAPIVYDKDGEPLRVAIQVSGNAKSSVFNIQATSSNPLFTQTYLNAIMEAYLDYKKNVRQEVSGDTLASISEQMQRWERDLNTEQDALLVFERTNNLAILQEEANGCRELSDKAQNAIVGPSIGSPAPGRRHQQSGFGHERDIRRDFRNGFGDLRWHRPRSAVFPRMRLSC